MTVGPTVSMLRWHIGFLEDVTLRGYAVGLQSTFYVSGPRFTDGWVIQPTFGYYSYDLDVTSHTLMLFGGTPPPPRTYAGNFHGFYAGTVAGYQWVWDELMSLSVGGGVTVYSQSRDQVVSGSGSTNGTTVERTLYGGVNPALMLNIGFVL